MGQNFVYFYGAKVCLALAPFLYNAIAQFLDEAIAHIRHGRSVRFQVKLHIVHTMLMMSFSILSLRVSITRSSPSTSFVAGNGRKARGFRFIL